ncbi:hypothetical protein BS78_05G050800 [Paspalum vaginatum]|nr:hypothetical protein BS78_05G050800 [Paspalum vaginatum]
MLRQLGPAVVLRGVAYWPMHHAALGVRLDGTSATMDVCSVPYKLTHCELDEHVLGVSLDGRLRFVGTGFTARRTLVISFLASQLRGVVGCNSVDPRRDDDDGNDIKLSVPQIEVTWTTAVKLRWFGEKSGTLILTVGETGSSTSDVFAFNIATRSVEKLASDICNHACRNLYGYEMITLHSLRP